MSNEVNEKAKNNSLQLIKDEWVEGTKPYIPSQLWMDIFRPFEKDFLQATLIIARL